MLDAAARNKNYIFPDGYDAESWPSERVEIDDLSTEDQAFLSEVMGDLTLPTQETAEREKRESMVAGIVPSFGGSYGASGVNTVERQGFMSKDAEGKEYVDLEQMILCMMIGHAHPKIERFVKIIEKIYPGVFMGTTVQNNDLSNKLAKMLNDALKPYGAFRTLFASTGTSANNQAVRLLTGALGGPKNARLVTMDGGYNGADIKMNAECNVPGWNGVTSAESEALKIARDGSDLDEKIAEMRALADKGQKPILLMEDGVQGVGGFYVYETEFMRKLVQAVKAMGGKVILDNVQAFVRNGKGLLGIDRWAEKDSEGNIPNDLKPDAVTFAKGLGNGRQIAATMVTEENLQLVAANAVPGSSFDTFSITPSAIAAAIVTLRESIDNLLWENVDKMGEKFLAGLREIAERYPDVVDCPVGTGGLTALKLRSKDLVAKAMNECKRHGLLIAKGGVEGTTLRLPLPANATEALVTEALLSIKEMVMALNDELKTAA